LFHSAEASRVLMENYHSHCNIINRSKFPCAFFNLVSESRSSPRLSCTTHVHLLHHASLVLLLLRKAGRGLRRRLLHTPESGVVPAAEHTGLPVISSAGSSFGVILTASLVVRKVVE